MHSAVINANFKIITFGMFTKPFEHIPPKFKSDLLHMTYKDKDVSLHGHTVYLLFNRRIHHLQTKKSRQSELTWTRTPKTRSFTYYLWYFFFVAGIVCAVSVTLIWERKEVSVSLADCSQLKIRCSTKKMIPYLKVWQFRASSTGPKGSCMEKGS